MPKLTEDQKLLKSFCRFANHPFNNDLYTVTLIKGYIEEMPRVKGRVKDWLETHISLGNQKSIEIECIVGKMFGVVDRYNIKEYNPALTQVIPDTLIKQWAKQVLDKMIIDCRNEQKK